MRNDVDGRGVESNGLLSSRCVIDRLALCDIDEEEPKFLIEHRLVAYELDSDV
jgi:hypothetical protein